MIQIYLETTNINLCQNVEKVKKCIKFSGREEVNIYKVDTSIYFLYRLFDLCFKILKEKISNKYFKKITVFYEMERAYSYAKINLLYIDYLIYMSKI